MRLSIRHPMRVDTHRDKFDYRPACNVFSLN